MTHWRGNFIAAGLAILTLMALVYWVVGPHELAPWRPFGQVIKVGDHTIRPRKLLWRKMAGENVDRLDHISLPILVQAYMRPGFNARVEGEPANWQELAFTRFLAFDATTAALLALSLLIWRRQNAPARQLALALALFAFSLAGFLINGQARLRENIFVWAGWPRLGLDLAVTLAFGLCVLKLERFFSSFPTKLEDWHVMQILLRWRGQPLVAEKQVHLFYRPGHTNLLAVSRQLPVAMTGLLLFGINLSTLPYLIFPVQAPTFSPEWGGTFSERSQQFGLLIGPLIGLIVLALLMAFGWLFSIGLVGKLRAGRENCTEEERRQIDWLFAGGLLVALMLMACSVGLILELALKALGVENIWLRDYSGGIEMLFFPSGWALILFALAGAIYFSRTFGPKPLLKRTILIAGVGLALSCVLVIVQQAVALKLLGQFPSGVQHGFSTMLSGGIVAFSFNLFRHRMEHGIDGFLNRFMPASVIADGKRREATVMFSDLEGYTALSVAHESQALLVAGHFQKVATEVARTTGGRVVKTIGDAVLWTFPNPSAAMAAATRLPVEFQRALKSENLPGLPVNSGIHQGSVVEAPDGDVYGAAVNLAARLQGAAKEGTIVASIEAVQEVTGGFKLAPLGKINLKNVPMPVVCFAVSAA